VVGLQPFGVATFERQDAHLAGQVRDRVWHAVHALDAAVLFWLVLEKAPAGTAWHAVSDQGDAVRDIAMVIGRRLGVPVEAIPQESFGPLGPIFATDQPSSSARTRQALGWEPSHPSLLEDLENIQP
jgi:nucleoside-diphosphate-sugar epimerase